MGRALIMKLILSLLIASALSLSAQTVTVVPGYPSNGGTITLYTVTDAKGNVLSYGESLAGNHPLQYSGHTAFQARIVTAPVPASASTKQPKPAVPSTSTLYTSYAVAEATFQKL